MSKTRNRHIRPHAEVLRARLLEPRRFIQVISGPRQVGKTTLVEQVTDEIDLPVHRVSADEPTLRGPGWLAAEWEVARLQTRGSDGILVIDEVQKAQGWSETVKRLWDEDTRHHARLKVVLLGSAPLLVEQGLSESLAGRFELLLMPHWSFTEMRDAFGFSVDEFVLFGGYPGAAPLTSDPERWRRHVLDALIETSVSRDVLLHTRIHKPALLRRLFELGALYSGQILSYNKMLGQLHDAGNTTTLAHYLDLLSRTGLVTGLAKFSKGVVRQRASSPKLQVLNLALQSAVDGRPLEELRRDPEAWGRRVESAVGAHLANAAWSGRCALFYWRHRSREVDFVVQRGQQVLAIEVKSGRARGARTGLDAFRSVYPEAHTLLVGEEGLSLETFLETPVEALLPGG